MAITVRQRKALPASAFVYKPGTAVGGKHGAYPINTVKRARAALSYSAHRNTKGSYTTVAAAVKRRYGKQITVGGSKRSSRKGSSGRRKR